MTCRDECAQSGEPLAGSAGAVYAFVAISWPKPKWDPADKARSQGMPPELAELEAREKANGRKLAIRLFQRDDRPSTDRVELIVARSGAATVHAVDVPVSQLVDRIRACLDGAAPAAPLTRRTVFVCTDGRHDRCCATFGRPVLLSLRTAVERRGLPCDVVETSHLGGHRFAANALVLPDGHLYGRVTRDDTERLADALAADRVLAARYRGRIDLDGPTQAAEACLRTRYPEAASIEPGRVVELGSGSVRVHAQLGDTETTLELERQPFDARASCSDDAPCTQVRWVPRRRAG